MARDKASQSADAGGSGRAGRQASPDVGVPLNLTLKQQQQQHGSATASPLHLASSSSSLSRSFEHHRHRHHHPQQLLQRSDPTYDPDTSQHPTLATLPPSAASTLADEVRVRNSVVISRPVSRLECTRVHFVQISVSVSRPDGQGLGLGLET